MSYSHLCRWSTQPFECGCQNSILQHQPSPRRSQYPLTPNAVSDPISHSERFQSYFYARGLEQGVYYPGHFAQGSQIVHSQLDEPALASADSVAAAQSFARRLVRCLADYYWLQPSARPRRPFRFQSRRQHSLHFVLALVVAVRSS